MKSLPCPIVRNLPGGRWARAARGFTLAELLAVMGIICLLAILGIGALKITSDQAENVKCVANLRQIGAGLLAFASEHEGWFPQAGGIIPKGEVDPKTSLPAWTVQLEDYVGNDLAVFRCPASAKVNPYNVHYGYFLGARAAFEEASEENNGRLALRQQKIQNPSKYILGGDIVGDMFTAEDADKDDFVYNPAFAKPSPFHGGKVNILFADGSVRTASKFDPETMEISYFGPGNTY